ncbi:MAG: hypothetical protein R3C13_08460 [Hyphomonas sp.]|uniref:hypothetical protein n=1 Tax=Hyphomonas sp. TaxID=87 RepID=UPI0035299932
MMRFISILILLAGLAVAGYGGSRLLEAYGPQDLGSAASDMTEAAPAEETVMESAPMEEAAGAEMAAEPAAVEVAEAKPAPEIATRSLPAPSLDDDLFSGESAAIDEVLMTPEVAPEVLDAPTAPAPDPAATFLETLQTVPVAHETPSMAEYKRPFEAVLALDATGDDTAADALPGRGNVQEGTARVSKRVEARLSGSGFAIKAMTPEQQTISPLTENTWRWSVTPLTAGSQELTFDIYAIDDGPAVPLRTFHNTVTVQVTGLNRAIAFADQANPLAVFLGGVGSILAGLFGAIKFVRKR